MKTETRTKFITELQNPERFKLLEDGWIQDSLTGLDFGPSSKETMDFDDAVKYCKKNGGRLPEVQELHSLVDYTKKDPATSDIFKDTKHDDWYWSGTKSIRYNDCRWCVSFSYGGVDVSFEYGNVYVRPVRSSQ